MNLIEFGDCREIMKKWAESGIKAQMCVTSPPYFGLRDYGHAGQIGLEETPEQYIAAMVDVFRCVRDVLADDGTLWLNLGDSYGKGKQLVGMPWRIAFALQEDGWVLRQDIIWSKPNPMPESVRDRCTKSHEYIFLLSKNERYFFDHIAIKEPAVGGRPGNVRPTKAGREFVAGDTRHRTSANLHKIQAVDLRNKRSVWKVPVRPFKDAHFATFPKDLIVPCINAGSRLGEVVLDPFMGSGTTAAVCISLKRSYLGCEINKDYGLIQKKRILLSEEEVKHSESQIDLFFD